ncbi:hypothetical protein QM797_08310 [Rhodococcus sp. IEGM 1381]|uniref:hypothetical protein n=1 Tax=Rhodococcus sp. IEGM 1381 TaxID=3047085 RepID=UPI0024B78D44|nr:hypothetical protein [Rhodococcus sp. IEGM 1381]MDI9894728.1 hypothetical protein [Rhodococcus sp. IEGM 1381]
MTGTVVIHYTIKHAHIEEELTRLGDVYAELEQLPAGVLNYDTYHIGEGAFIALVSGDAEPELLQTLPTFQEYRRSLDERCIRPPEMSSVHQIFTTSMQRREDPPRS